MYDDTIPKFLMYSQVDQGYRHVDAYVLDRKTSRTITYKLLIYIIIPPRN